MSKTVVHVETIEQWKSVLGIWFKQGYTWPSGYQDYSGSIFENGGIFLFLGDYITYSMTNSNSKPFIEYSEFVAQQKRNNEMETYYVTQEQLDLIEKLKGVDFPLYNLVMQGYGYKGINDDFSVVKEKALLRYLGGDTSVEFKVKEQLYRLWRIDDYGERDYMKLGIAGTPTYTPHENSAFTAPREEIEKHKTVSWEIEKAD